MMNRGRRTFGIGLILLLIAITISACGSNDPHTVQQTSATNSSQQIDGPLTDGTTQDDNTSAALPEGDAVKQNGTAASNDAVSKTDSTGADLTGDSSDTAPKPSEPANTNAGVDPKAGAKSDTKTGSKSDSKTDSKSATKSDNKSDNKSDDKSAQAVSSDKIPTSSSSDTQSEDKPKADDDAHMQSHEHADNTKSEGAGVPTKSRGEQAKPESGAAKPSDDKKESATDSAKNHVVEIVDFAFSPATLDVKKGDTVTFINRDAVKHSATADDESFDTKLLGQDEQMTVTFNEEGNFSYYCLPHPAMTGTITVK